MEHDVLQTDLQKRAPGMSSGNPKPSHHRFQSAFSQGTGHFLSSLSGKVFVDEYDLVMGIKRSRECLLKQQSKDGRWNLRHQTDISLALEYSLLLVFLGRENSEKAKQTIQVIQANQSSDGGWTRFPGGPVDLNRTVLAYLALKFSGLPSDSEEMTRAREAILSSGGIEAVNKATRLWLALFGIVSYESCPVIPPELLLLPKWAPFSRQQISSQCRSKLVPFSLVWNNKPVKKIAPAFQVNELFRTNPKTEATLPQSGGAALSGWDRTWLRLEPVLKRLDRWNLRPFKKRMAQKAYDLIRERFKTPQCHGIGFSTLIWNLLALKSQGESEDTALFQNIWLQLEELIVHEGEELQFQENDYSVRDTALATLALREAQVSPDHQSLQKGVNFLLSQEYRFEPSEPPKENSLEPSGWSHGLKDELNQQSIDVSCLVLMALCRSLPENNLGQWTADLLLDDWSPHEADKEVSAIVSTNALNAIHATLQIERLTPILNSLRRGCRWILAQQRKEGGWSQYNDEPGSRFNPLKFLETDQKSSTVDQVDLTARMLEMFSILNISREHIALKRAVQNVWLRQERDFTWPGYRGINYLHGTAQSLVGLISINLPKHDARLLKAIDWLEEVQQDNGGWGETPASYETPSMKACGNTTPTQTAQVVLALLAAGKVESQEVAKGISYLLNTQNEEGTWNEQDCTSVIEENGHYCNHQIESISYPLIALTRYRQLLEQSQG